MPSSLLDGDDENGFKLRTRNQKRSNFLQPVLWGSQGTKYLEWYLLDLQVVKCVFKTTIPALLFYALEAKLSLSRKRYWREEIFVTSHVSHL